MKTPIPPEQIRTLEENLIVAKRRYLSLKDRSPLPGASAQDAEAREREVADALREAMEIGIRHFNATRARGAER